MTAEAEVDKAIAALQSSLRHSKENEQLTARLRDLMTACANLSREAETATQLSMKNEAMVTQLRNDLAESRATELALRRECVELASQSHALVDSAKMLVRSGECSASALQDKLRCENNLLCAENYQLRSTIKVLQEQLSSCDLGLRYMEKEVSGRVQQVQLVLVELETVKPHSAMFGIATWQQLNDELTLQRHKSMVDILRRNDLALKGGMPPCPHVHTRPQTLAYCKPRNVLLTKSRQHDCLGFSVAGGKEFGIGLFVSTIEPNSPAQECGGLFVGDHILALNGCDVCSFTKAEFVDFVRSCEDVIFDFVVVFQSNLCDHRKHASSDALSLALDDELPVDDPRKPPSPISCSQSAESRSPTLPSWTPASGGQEESLGSIVSKTVQQSSARTAAGVHNPVLMSGLALVPDPTAELFSSL